MAADQIQHKGICLISDTDIAGIVDQQLANAQLHQTQLEQQQADMLDYYYGRPFGNEVDGSSKVVTRDVLEVTEWQLAQLLKIFNSGEQIVRFDPRSAEDEEQAEQETDYVNYIVNHDNEGFKIFHDWIKTALIQKNAYIKVGMEDEEEVKTETYYGLTDQELAAVMSDGAEAIEYAESINEFGLTHDIKLNRTTTERRIKIECVPQEQLYISTSHNKLSLKDCPFVAHRVKQTISGLIEQGYSKKILQDLPAAENKQRILDTARDPMQIVRQASEADESTKEVDIYECYIRADFRKKGVAQLWKVVKAGDKILDREEIDFVPFATICPCPLPFQHIGLSEADKYADIQLVNSVLMRQILNNLYLTNNPEKEVVEDQVNMPDLMESVAGGIKRVKQPGMIRELTVPFTAGASFPMLDILEGMKQRRVGGTMSGNGTVDPNLLAQSTSSAFILSVEQSNQQIEKIARIFAETGFKELFGMIHELAIKYQDKARIVKLRNDYVQVDPQEWSHRASMSIAVGLGTSSKDRELQSFAALADKQEQHLLQGSPIVTIQNLYATYKKLMELSGVKDVTPYFTDPEAIQQAPQEPQQDPQQIAIMAQIEVEKAKLELQSQKQQAEIELAVKDIEIRERELALKEQELMITAQSTAASLDAKKYDSDLKAELQIILAQIKKSDEVQASIMKLIPGFINDIS